MPPIASNKEELDGLKNLVDRSVVVLVRKKEDINVGFGTGFVIFANRRRALICIDKSLIKDDESITVWLHDIPHQTARVFFEKSISRQAVLEVGPVAGPHLNLRPVTFSESEIMRQDVFTVAAVHMEGDLGLLTGTVGNPNCKAIHPNGDPAYRSEDTFAFSCPVPGRSEKPYTKQGNWNEPKEFARIIGAAVFDKAGMVIGTLDTTDPRSDGTKFAIKTSFFLDKLENYLKAKDKRIYLLRGGRGSGQGSRTSRHHDTTSESASRKRGRVNTPRGGMGTGKSLCVSMTRLEGTVEVVNKKQPRLNKYPVQGDMDRVRKEAFERALIRLVTQEPDDALRSSCSDVRIKAKKRIKVFIARNPGVVGSHNSIDLQPFDPNQFFGGDVKIYDFKSLKNGATDQVDKIIKVLNDGQIASTDVIEVVLSAPYVFFPNVKDKLRPEIQVAAQNCCVKKGGAFSGEVSAEMLSNLGIPWVILGHSERMSLWGESSEFVGDKVAYALAQGLKVIACVGETLEQQGAGYTMAVVAEQTKSIADKVKDWTNVVIAYRPVWAIGTGKVATPAQAQEVHANLRDWLKTNVSPEVAKSTKIIYGGFVTGASANELAAQPDIDGFLVGGASLKS